MPGAEQVLFSPLVTRGKHKTKDWHHWHGSQFIFSRRAWIFDAVTAIRGGRHNPAACPTPGADQSALFPGPARRQRQLIRGATAHALRRPPQAVDIPARTERGEEKVSRCVRGGRRVRAQTRVAQGRTYPLPPNSPRHGHYRQGKLRPVRRSNASIYFSRVLTTTSSGNSGGGLFWSQSVVSSQSRTNCLSNDGGLPPGRY